MKKKKGFTLIELVAVLVIMAIIAIIATPLVIAIIRKARVSADKRSIDAYGRSIELAIASYLLDTGKFPIDVSQLTIEYSGSEVVCETTQLNSDSSVYLTGCTVGGRSVDYAYGSDKTPSYTAYSKGYEVTYNGVNYYVIQDSGIKNNTVKLLKKEPLLKTEIEGYNISGLTVGGDTYGTVRYGSSGDYTTSTVKQVVDAWKNTAVSLGDIASVRLLSYDDLLDDLGYDMSVWNVSNWQINTEFTPTWVYSSDYWISGLNEDNSSYLWQVSISGDLTRYDLCCCSPTKVRPVLELSKSANITLVNS